MASLVKSKTKSGMRYFIQLSPGESQARPKISLGRVSKNQANTAKANIEALIACKNGGGLAPAVADKLNLWIDDISDGLRKRLETLNIIEPKGGKNYMVAEWVNYYIDMRRNDSGTKADTVRKFENVARRLAVFFKGDKLEDVNVLQTKAFKGYLVNQVGLAENTARKHISISRQFFNAAIDGGHIVKNPFRGQTVKVRPNQERFYYVEHETALKVLDACPDAQWRLIFGLARWGGLRCPSEVLRLKWEDVDFDNDRFTVHASKTEHHENSDIGSI